MAKAEATPIFLPVDAKAMTVAAYAEMSRQAMTDTPELQRTVDTVLPARLDTKLDAVLINGSGTDWDGLDALASPYVHPDDDLVDAIGQGADQVLTAGFVPDAVLLNPTTWTQLRTAKDGNGRYQGSYLESPPPAILGLPMYLSPATAAGEAVSAELGYTGTQFTANLATLLVEMRVAALYRAVGAAARVTVTV